MTPLHLAALLGHSDVAECLLDSRADAAKLDNKGKPPLALLQIEALRYVFEEEQSSGTHQHSGK